MRVKDIMTREVITITADTTVDEIARLLTEHRIGGLPVIDDKNQVIGFVTESNLFLKEKGLPFSAVRVPTLFKHWVDPDRLTEILEEAGHHTAADVMSSISVNADDSVGHAAWVMAQHDIRRVPLLQNGVLAGIVSRSGIIHLLAGDKE